MSIQLQPYRAQIDNLDNKILDLLAQRFEVVRQVGALKTAENIEIVQTTRAQEVLERVTEIAQNNNIPAPLIHGFYTAMIEEAHKIEFGIQAEGQSRNAKNA